MSPFAAYLKELRLKRGLKQKEAADLLGYEPSYWSALERSQKGSPRRDFVERLIRAFKLSEAERSELLQKLEKSRRQVALPCNAPLAEYELIHELSTQLGQLHPLQIQLIRQALAIPHAYGMTSNDIHTPIPVRQEAAMT